MTDARSGAAEALYGAKSASLPQKAVMQVFSWGAVAAAAWFLFGGGREVVAAWLRRSWQPATPLRADLLVACSAIYAARLVFTQFYLVKRRMTWSEAATISAWLWIIHATMTFLGGWNRSPMGIVAWLGVALYAFGSFLNTGSELLRDIWKKQPANRSGRLYTRGLFRYSMHINYFGDVVLFSGFALVTGRGYAFVIPALMACMFVFVNIPMLDAYLASRYGAQFDDYAERTAKLIPFIY